MQKLLSLYLQFCAEYWNPSWSSDVYKVLYKLRWLIFIRYHIFWYLNWWVRVIMRDVQRNERYIYATLRKGVGLVKGFVDNLDISKFCSCSCSAQCYWPSDVYNKFSADFFSSSRLPSTMFMHITFVHIFLYMVVLLWFLCWWVRVWWCAKEKASVLKREREKVRIWKR